MAVLIFSMFTISGRPMEYEIRSFTPYSVSLYFHIAISPHFSPFLYVIWVYLFAKYALLLQYKPFEAPSTNYTSSNRATCVHVQNPTHLLFLT